MKLITPIGIALAAMAITGFAGAADAASIPVTNAGFETPAGPDGFRTSVIDGSNGWLKSGGGQIYNPGNDLNAPEGSNSYLILEGIGGYDLGSGDIVQVLGDVLEAGDYALTVQVGENVTTTSSFGSGYQVQLGVMEADGITFTMLAEDNSSLSPSNGFLTSTVNFSAAAGDGNLGKNLAIRLAGQVIAGSNNQVLFDDVQLEFVAAPGDVDVYLRTERFDKTMSSGGAVAMWGFVSCDATFTTCGDIDAPGPKINAFAGFALNVHVQNTLGIPVSISIPGQAEAGRAPVMMSSAPNRVQSFTHETAEGSVSAPSATATYTWPSLKAGSYIYQSGTLPSIEVPMGLYGALVVNEGSGGTAYGYAYDTEAMLFLSEIDPIQNARVDAAATALPGVGCVSLAEYEQDGTAGYPCTVDYNPTYFLVNGGATAELPAATLTDATALLRFLNAGLRSHTPTIVGVELGLVAEDGNAYRLPRNQSAALLAAGKTLDAIIDLPGSDVTFTLFDRMPTFSNENLPNGGSLATMNQGSGAPVVPPTASPAMDDRYSVTEDNPLTVVAPGVLLNDAGLTGAVLLSAPAHGTVALGADGSFTYTPNQDFSGADSFTYSAGDGTNTFGATVMLNVSFDNDLPVAAGDAYSNNVGTQISVPAPGVLANDADADGDPLYAALVTGTVTLNADGSFDTSAGGSFTYVACDQPLDTLGACPAGAASNEVTVDLTLNTGTGLALNVHEPVTDPSMPPVTVTAYRWTLEEDTTFHPDPAILNGESLASTFHRSYMPVVAQGCVGAGACSEGESETPFGDAYLDPAKHYFVSVLPSDAVLDNGEPDFYRVGHTIGGAQIPPAAQRTGGPIDVIVNKQPLEYAQISVLIFEDNSPTNGAVDGAEVGLGGVQVFLEDAGGRYGMSAGALSQDADGNPLTNALDCFGGAPPQPGVIVSCPNTAANQAADLVGHVLIKNLFPGKYGVIAVPPTGGPDTWIQTSTIEGTKVIDAWVKSGEPPYFAEFGPVGVHAFIGFVSPERVNDPGRSGQVVSGHVSNMHMGRPPDQNLYPSGNYDALAHTRPWVGLNSVGGIGPNIAAVQADIDEATGEARFEIPNVPDGDYQIVVWDSFLDQVIAYRSVTVSGAPVDAGEIAVFNWFARLENWVFLDENGDGIRDATETGIPEQAVNVRWRDGSMYQSFPTDLEGFVPFDQVFPFFNWLVAEVDFTRFKATGVTVTVDGGGDVTGTGNVLNPQIQLDGCTDAGCTSRTETEPAPVLVEGFQAFLGQTNVLEWGKAPYAVGENGGISGIVYYGVTRAESDPRLAAAEPWEPGIPGVTVRLYRQVSRAPTSIAVANAGFEIPAGSGVLDTLVDGSNGWIKTGGGQIYNPGLDANAPEGFNSYLILNSIAGYDLGDGSVQQQLADVLEEGTYSLSVQVGENATTNSSFGEYRVQLGVFDGSNFILLAEDNNSLAPSNQFLTSTVEYTAYVGNVNLGLPLVIRLVGNVSGTGNIQVLFDDVQLTYSENALALVDEAVTDSWDESLPTGCPGADPVDMQIVGPDEGQDPTDAITTKCYDGLRAFNQVRPAVFDGGYAFGDIPPGKYVVEVVPPAGYEILKEEDVNVGFGDGYASVFVAMPGGAVLPGLPDPAMIEATATLEPGIAQPPCVGAAREVPLIMSLFPQAAAEAPFATASRPLCNRKAVVLSDQGQAAADFTLITDAPIAGHFTGMVLDDVAQEFSKFSPQFGEKWAPPFVPVSIRDFKGAEIGRVYSDQWGRMNGLLPSTYTANMPSPSGFSPAMHMTCMNDPGPIPGPGGTMILDPQYNPAYSNFCYTFQYMPGTTTYLDTPVLPVSAFASGYNPADCALPSGTPMIAWVDGPNGGPLAQAGESITIHSMGSAVQVPNPAYEGPGTSGPKTITRDFSFGTQGAGSSVTIGGVELTVTSWDGDTIVATVTNPGGATIATGQLVVTRDSGVATETGLTMTVSNDTPIRVPGDYATIQAAIDNAAPGALILVAPGAYNESVIMWKPVRLQGAGAGATIINAVKRPTEQLVQWRDKMDCLFGIGAGCTREVDGLPNQPDGAVGFDVSEGAGITVIGVLDVSNPRPANSFLRGPAEARIDGFAFTGADVGGGILVNSNAHRLEISNNRVFGNHGNYHGGIRIGQPFLELPAPVGDFNGFTYGFNTSVNIHDNAIVQNGSLDGAGGGVSINMGSDNYDVDNNYVCGNFSLGNGGGIGHLGLSDVGRITNNRILFNQTFNQGVQVSGGGVFIAGEPPVAGELTLGAGDVDVLDNVIQGNHAGAGNGGGIRTQFINGLDVQDAITQNGNLRTGRWHRINVRRNAIVNNVAGGTGGGVSLQDTVRSDFRNNVIAHNDSTATLGGLIVNNVSTNQPAGLSTENHSLAFAGVFPVAANTADIRVFSNPFADPSTFTANNALWDNRSFFYNADRDGNPSTDDAGLVPALSQASVGECPAGATIWNLDGLLGGSPVLNGETANPGFANPYCNGGRTLDTGPGEMMALPALDEGGNAWVDVRFGPLTPAWPAGAPAWTY